MRPLFLVFLFCFFIQSSWAISEKMMPTTNDGVGQKALLELESERQQLLDLIFGIRQQYGAQTFLRTDAVADTVSSDYVKVLYSGTLKHIDSSGRNSVARYRQEGGSGLSTGEILGRGPKLEMIVDSWLKSPRHRQVLLDKKWTAIGLGIHKVAGIYTVAILFTTSISHEHSYRWNDDKLSVYVTLRDGIRPDIWLKAGGIHATPVSIEDDKFLVFDLDTNGPERVLIFNASGQGDLLIVPSRGQ